MIQNHQDQHDQMMQIKDIQVNIVKDMPIFPSTFNNDKPIYYPQTWERGLTAGQLYQQWIQSQQYWILSNILQCVLGGLWMWFISVLFSAIYEIWKLYRLDESDKKKLVNRKFIDKKFVMSVGFICFAAFFITVSLLVYRDNTRYAIIKGYFSYTAVKWTIKIKAKLQQLYMIWRKDSHDQFGQSDQSDQEAQHHQ